jgi:hypothetical protein
MEEGMDGRNYHTIRVIKGGRKRPPHSEFRKNDIQ